MAGLQMIAAWDAAYVLRVACDMRMEGSGGTAREGEGDVRAG
jgi:hypothetical protein